MMNVYTVRQLRPLERARKITHTYLGYPQHVTHEKIWQLEGNMQQRRIYLHNHFICDVITDEEVLILVQPHTIHICNSYGHEYYMYEIKEGE